MTSSAYTLNTLFDQLGLEDSDEGVAAFIHHHRPLPGEVALHQAPFWNASQAAFLQQAIAEDADWAEVVDQLDTALRE